MKHTIILYPLHKDTHNDVIKVHKVKCRLLIKSHLDNMKESEIVPLISKLKYCCSST